MTGTTLGSETAACAALVTKNGTKQAALAAGEIDLQNHPHIEWGNAAAVDPLFTALSAQTVVGRLVSEDPMSPSAILIDRTGGTKGATIAQVSFVHSAQVAPFVAASNWLAARTNPEIARLEIAATIGPALKAAAPPGASFWREQPDAEIIGRGTLSAIGAVNATGVPNAIAGKSTIGAVTAPLRVAGKAPLVGAGKVASDATIVPG